MKRNEKEFALEWLMKANNDIITAQCTLAVPNGPTDTPCFHAQQAIEKSLKAVLTYHCVSLPKIHDLMRLLDLASPFLPVLAEYREKFAEISGYSVEVRYPGNSFNPSRDDSQEALKIAEEVVNLVTTYLKSPREIL